MCLPSKHEGLSSEPQYCKKKKKKKATKQQQQQKFGLYGWDVAAAGEECEPCSLILLHTALCLQGLHQDSSEHPMLGIDDQGLLN
jgi:hypothetical protein